MSDYLNYINNKFPIRRTKKEKELFRDYVISETEKSCYRAYTEKLKRSENVVVGDIHKAKVIFTAHYDTPATAIVPNLMMPKNPVLNILHQNVLWGVVCSIQALFSFLVADLIVSDKLLLNLFLSLSMYALLFLLSFRVFKNRHNKNDNTSGVAVIMSLISKCTSENIAFVLFDNEEKGLCGSGDFNKKYKELMKEKLVVNFDCVGVGNNILFVVKKAAENHNLYKNLKEYNESNDNYNILFFSNKKAKLNSDNKKFECGIGVASCKKKKGVYYAGKIHTNRDKEAYKENIDFITDNMLEFITSIT